MGVPDSADAIKASDRADFKSGDSSPIDDADYRGKYRGAATSAHKKMHGGRVI